MILGKIAKSDSQIHYICQVNGPHEVEVAPEPADYVFGRFVRVRVALHSSAQPRERAGQSPDPRGATDLYVVGVICDTVLHNRGLDATGPRLSNEAQTEVFTPDYLAEKIALVHVLTLGMMELEHRTDSLAHVVTRTHGVPLSLKQDLAVETMTDEEIRAFHVSSTPGVALEMGYLLHLRSEGNTIFPAVVLEIIGQLESLIPHAQAWLGIIKQTVAWKHKVVPMA